MTIHLEHIGFSYDKEKKVIDDISAAFDPGNFYSIVGPNGSGKTTLLDLMSGYIRPHTGCIRLGETSIFTLPKKVIAKTIALVSQDYSINFPFSVKDVVLMGRHPYIPRFSHPSRQDLKKAEEAMSLCRITHLAERKVSELSGGERQRCVFARAICQDTPILFLDEAFSNMDIHHTLQLLSLVKQQVREKDKMVISVFHDLNLAAGWSDRILMLKNGKMKAFGDSDDVITPENISRVFGVSAVVEFNRHVRAKQVYYPSI